MKLRNRIISLAFFAIIAFSMVIPAFAVENVATPYYNNTATTQEVFQIDESGAATTSFVCRGYRGITTSISVETKIQKQVNTSWVDVEGASWTDESTLYYCSQNHSVQLTERGTYKAVFTFTVAGSGGETDVIVREIQKTY